MRVLGGFVAGVMAGVGVWSVAFVLENPDASLDLALTVIVVCLLLGAPAALAGGVPIGLLLRAFKVQAWWIYSLMGALLGLGIYLVIGVPTSQPFDHTTYAENLARPLHRWRVLVTMLAGWIGALVFWDIAVNSRRRDRLLRGVRVRMRRWRRKVLVAIGGGRNTSDLKDA